MATTAEVLELLWPGHVPARSSRHGGRSLVLYPADRPRLIVPVAPSRVSANAVWHYNTASTGLAAVRRAAAGAALRVGAGAVLPGRVDLAPVKHRSIEAELSRSLGGRVYVAAYLGPPRAVQKVVLQVLGDDGRTIAFAKLGIDDFTDRLVDHEADALRRLGERPLTHLRVPALIHHGRWNGHSLLIQQALPGRRLLPRAALRTEAELEACAVFGAGRRVLGETGLARRLSQIAAATAHDIAHGRLVEVIDRVLTEYADVPLTIGAGHGDWTPWNMTTDGRRLLVWDWEGLSEGTPLGFDTLHHEVNRLVAVAGRTPLRAVPDVADRAPMLLQPLGVDEATSRVVALCYVVDLAARYVRDGEADLRGTALSRLDEWLDPCLDHLLESA